MKPSWKPDDYLNAKRTLAAYDFSIEIGTSDLHALKAFLGEERQFMLRLLENQNLLEHESFTDLLWATFHLAEELDARSDLDSLPTPDSVHIAGDMKRVYGLLLVQWLDYMRHLQSQYPFLFSLAVRINPLDPNAKAEVQA